jgi:hypothetical protein
MKIDQGTVGTPASASQGIQENGPAGLPLMSEAGKKNAAKAAPTSVLRATGKIGTSDVDRQMRGKR